MDEEMPLKVCTTVFRGEWPADPVPKALSPELANTRSWQGLIELSSGLAAVDNLRLAVRDSVILLCIKRRPPSRLLLL
jgi:hypothetical protein